MVDLLVRVQQQASTARLIVVAILAILFVPSLCWPFELFHSYHLSVGAIWGCVVLLVRDSDVFRLMLPLPIPLLIGLILLTPFMRAWRSKRSRGARAG